MEQFFNIPKLYTSILLEGIQYSKFPKGWDFHNHRHSMFEFIYCASGRVEQWVNGQPFVLREGDSLIIKNGLFHHTAPLTEDTDFFVFHFDVDMKEVQSIFFINPDPFIPSQQPESGILTVAQWVKEFIRKFRDELVQHDDSYRMKGDELLSSSITRLQIQVSVLELIILLANHIMKKTNVYLNHKIRPFETNLAHEVAYDLELNYGEKLQISELAEKMGVHRSYLSTSFKQVYGISPRKYFTKVKIRTAKQLLQNTDLTIEKIAVQLNFSSSAHFSKFFLNAVGLSPLKYRNQQR